MTEPFEQAWTIAKHYKPSWRKDADKLPILEDIDQYFELDNPDFSRGSSIETVTHPLDERFVIKRPILPNYGGWKKEPSQSDMDRYNRTLRNPYFRHGGWEEFKDRKGLPQIMEELGFPVVSEKFVHQEGPNSYIIQPKLSHDPDERGLNADMMTREEMITELALAHAFGDYNTVQNFMFDPLDRIRFMDFGTDFPDEYEEMGGEYYQGLMDRYDMQLPASRLLDLMDENLIDHDRYKEYLEEMEQYSANPSTLRIGVTSPYLVGYDE